MECAYYFASLNGIELSPGQFNSCSSSCLPLLVHLPNPSVCNVQCGQEASKPASGVDADKMPTVQYLAVALRRVAYHSNFS